MKDPQSTTIVLLLAAAVVLGAMLLSSYTTLNEAAYAGVGASVNPSIELVNEVDLGRAFEMQAAGTGSGTR